MELLQLKYFKVVAQYENMSRAADDLNIAQPAVSQSIARLEDELGMKLFERRGKRIVLNDNGHFLLKKIPLMLEPFNTIKNEMADFANHPVQHICILVLSSSVLIPELLMAFRKEHPNIEFSLMQNENTGNHDVCISSAPIEKMDVDATLLLNEEIVLAVPSSSFLARYEKINLKDLGEEDFISLGMGSPMRLITDYYCDQVGFKPHIIFESDNPSTVRGLIEVGLGIAFYPIKTWGRLDSTTVKAISIADVKCRRSIFIKIPTGKYITKAVSEFYLFAIEYYKSYGHESGVDLEF